MYKYYLTYLDTKSELEAEPIGWDNFETILKRNEKYHGISAEFSELDLQFWCSVSLSILKTAYADDIDSVVLFSVENDSVLEYSGHVDFGDYQHAIDKFEYVKVKVAEIGTQTIFNNRIDQKVDLDSVVGFDGATLTTYSNLKKVVSLPAVPIVLETRCKNQISGGDSFNSTGLKYYGFPAYDGITNTELGNTTFEPLLVYESEETFPICDINEDNKFTFIDGKLKGRIYIDFFHHIAYSSWVDRDWINDFATKYPANGEDFISAKIKLYRKRNGVNTTIYETTEVNPYTYSKIHGDGIPYYDPLEHAWVTPRQLQVTMNMRLDEAFDLDVDVQTFDSFHLAIIVNMKSDLGGYWAEYASISLTVNPVTFYNVTAKSIVPASTASLAFVHEALSRVAENITNNGTGVASTYYGRTDSNTNSVGTNGKGALKVIGSGLRVRNASLTGGNTAFSASFLDLMKGIAPIDNVGWGFVGSQLRVESWEYFYNNTTILTITSPSTISRLPNKAAIFSRIKVGFSKFESEGINGLDAFCTDREYRTSVKAIDTKLEIISPFVADSYAFEKTRRLQGDKATTDSNYDENIFILCLKRSSGGAYSVDAGCTDAGTTVISPNYVYNARISPIRNLKRWAKQLLTFNRSNNIASFGSGTCNYLANITPKTESGYTYNYDADTTPTAENADVTNSAELLKAETVTIKEYAITMAQYNTIKANPYGTVIVDGEPMFIKELRYKRKTGQASFTLLPKKV